MQALSKLQMFIFRGVSPNLGPIVLLGGSISNPRPVEPFVGAARCQLPKFRGNQDHSLSSPWLLYVGGAHPNPIPVMRPLPQAVGQRCPLFPLPPSHLFSSFHCAPALLLLSGKGEQELSENKPFWVKFQGFRFSGLPLRPSFQAWGPHCSPPPKAWACSI